MVFVASNARSVSKHNKVRIASGEVAKKGEFLDFCHLTVSFVEKQKTCGCAIYDTDLIITSARCVIE